LIAVAFLELYPKAEMFGRENLSPALSAISHYLELNMRGGKLRVLDSTMLTAALVMTSLLHPEISKLIGGQTPKLNSQEAGRAYSGFWLDLLTPRTPVYAVPSEERVGEPSG
jgi:hypothetical protein